jgi:SAM-dependent methyltransferase
VATADREYVLGTHDEEIARLALQHRVWRAQVLDAWRRAGFGRGRGQTILDIGSGSGNATLDLAAIAGPDGRVIATDKSRRFLDVVESRAREADLTNVHTFELDLDRDPLPEVMADGAWDRWAISFMSRPRDFLTRVAARLRPGAAFVIHEYFDYATWRTSPPSPEIEMFVAAVMRAWRESGGEPDLGLQLPAWLDVAGFEVHEVRPIVEACAPGEPKWDWLAAFVESGRQRLASLGTITADESRAVAEALARFAADPRTRMITPGLFEIIAVRR